MHFEDLVCPLDKAALQHESQAFVCSQCKSVYPITTERIPNFIHTKAKVDTSHYEEEIELHKELSRTYTEKRYAPEFSRLYQSHWNTKMIDLGTLNKESVVLDLGCGTGIMLADLAVHCDCVYGADISMDMLLKFPPDGSEHVQLICASGDQLPFPDNHFDAVLCRGAIHHFPNLPACFTEIKRILKPGGKLVFSEPSNDFPLNKLARYLMYKLHKEFHEDDEGFTRRQVIPLLHTCGFDITYSGGFGFFAYTFAGFPDKFPALNYIPGAVGITKAMIVIDNFLSKVPLITNLALHWQVVATAKSE